MAVYGEPRRFNTPLILVGVLAVILLVVGGGLVFTRLRKAPGPEAQRRLVDQEIQRMTEGLDVLTISHYTDEVVQGGHVLLPEEYQAARENLRQLQQRFERIQPYLDPQQAAEVEAALTTLRQMVDNKRSPADVQQQAERLMALLAQLGR